MGFDLCGNRPEGELGHYWRNNICWWPPLWSYAHYIVPEIITPERYQAGCCNDGHEFTAQEAQAIGEKLMEAVLDGRAAQEEAEYQAYLAALPDETCDWCQGTGIRDDEHVQEILREGTDSRIVQSDTGVAVGILCNGCHGKGTREAFQKSRPFSAENVKEFAEFCLHSQGFCIL